ncbi:hypothetical protein Tco_0770001 [Tanacetum coccineum]|uniref:Uncharacterized protein n=1 Tax=Tanacetum coccineum TaxID=301880 RepID=A0ABQ4ZBX3_9ASTR
MLKPGMFRIASTTTQTRTPQLPRASRNTNPHMSKSSGVNHTTSVSRPQLKCYQVKDKVMPNNTSNDIQNTPELANKNADFCAECGTCVFNSNHDACVSRYLKDVNARPKKPNVEPIVLVHHQEKANKFAATPHKENRDLIQGNVTIKLFITSKGLNHNLFLGGQLCDADLELLFQEILHLFFVRDLQGNDFTNWLKLSPTHCTVMARKELISS